MRIFFKYLLLCCFMISGCSDKKNEDLFIKLDTDILTFISDGGEQTIAVSSNGEWSVSGETDWCSVSPKTGSGNLTVTVTITENKLPNEQTALLTFTCGSSIAKVGVTQAAILPVQSNYVDMEWDKNMITAYDENTGAITIQFQGVIPTLESNKVIILPEDYSADIRVIKSVIV